jgi:hypothetical protein
MAGAATTVALSHTTEVVAAVLFAIAVLHTFSTKYFEKLSHKFPNHHGLFHLLAEVEAVFGFWSDRPRATQTLATTRSRCLSSPSW